jgi:hypothetical protein
MARTTAPPQAAAIFAIVTPAIIETTSVSGLTTVSSFGLASAKLCGLTASTSAVMSANVLGAGLSRRPWPTSLLISGEGCGSIAATRLAASPAFSHPASSALPILPAPASTIVPLAVISGLDELAVIGQAAPFGGFSETPI